MSKISWNKEIDEALVACDKTLIHLKSALKEVESAKAWGIFDIVAGGFFSSLIKKGHLDDLEKELQYAKEEARLLSEELEDLEDSLNIDLNLGDFLLIGDLVFDNFIYDILVQDKMDRAEKKIKKAILEVEAIKESLFNAKKMYQ